MAAATSTATATETGGVLARWIAARGASDGDRSPAAPKPTPQRAAATAVGRAAQQSAGLPIYPSAIRIQPLTLGEMAEILPERALLCAVESGADRMGVAVLCPSLVAALIEMQSLGRVSASAPRERRPTRTDAAISADFINAALRELATELSVLSGFDDMAGYRYASFVADPKPLELMLDDVAFRALTVDMRVGVGGVRDASLTVILPLAAGVAAIPPRAATPLIAAPGDGAGDGHPRCLSKSVHAAPVAVNAILCRRRMTLRELRTLVPGQQLALPADVVDGVRLETAGGAVLAQGRLGAFHGSHAIRITRAAQSGPAEDSGIDAQDIEDNMFSNAAWANDAAAPGPQQAAPLMFDPPAVDLGQPDDFRPPDLDLVAGDAPVPIGEFGLPANFVIE